MKIRILTLLMKLLLLKQILNLRRKNQLLKNIHEDDPVEFIVRNTNKIIEPEETEETEEEITEAVATGSIIHDFENDGQNLYVKSPEDGVPINISRPDAEDRLSEAELEKLRVDYDPRLDLSHYKFPPVSLLKEHKSENSFDNTEVFENKENIIKTLGDHKIGVKSISATIGPNRNSL